MMPEVHAVQNPFDDHADDYTQELHQGLGVTGETQEFFARGRLNWLLQRLRDVGETPRAVLDFGCGPAASTRWLFEILRPEHLVGLDSSAKSIAMASAQPYIPRSLFTRLTSISSWRTGIYCNGVFYHIPPHERLDTAGLVARSLRRGGVLSFWENNPWNPGTRYVMSRIPFDRDAIMVWPLEATRLLMRSGFDILRVDYLFSFPKSLRILCPRESYLCRLPLGGQYHILCRKR
jgi:SAM-dependent methyltransferase